MDVKKKLYLLLLIKLILVVFNLCSKNIDIFSILPLSYLDVLNQDLSDIVRGFIYSFQYDMAIMSDGPGEIKDIDPPLLETSMSSRNGEGNMPSREELLEISAADRQARRDVRANQNWMNCRVDRENLDNENHVYDPHRQVTNKRIHVPNIPKEHASEAVIKQMELEKNLESERLRISREVLA